MKKKEIFIQKNLNIKHINKQINNNLLIAKTNFMS